MDMNLHTADGHTIINHRDYADSFGRADAEIRPIAPNRVAVATVAYGSGWYHDSAITQAHQASIEARSNPYR